MSLTSIKCCSEISFRADCRLDNCSNVDAFWIKETKRSRPIAFLSIHDCGSKYVCMCVCVCVVKRSFSASVNNEWEDWIIFVRRRDREQEWKREWERGRDKGVNRGQNNVTNIGKIETQRRTNWIIIIISYICNQLWCSGLCHIVLWEMQV